MRTLRIYTDGGCRGNGNEDSIGGYGVVVLTSSNVVTICKGYKGVTNNQMELMAVIEAIRYVLRHKLYNKYDEVEIYSDSSYTLNGLQSWVHGWKKKGWVTSKGDPVKNKEMWEKALEYSSRLRKHTTLKLTKVKGHSGVEYNELADQLTWDAELGVKRVEELGINNA